MLAIYKAKKLREKIEINGDLKKPVWEKAEKSPRFVDIVSGKPALYDTRSSVLWDDEYLYIAYWIEEPFITATYNEDNELLFNENNVELFIDGGDSYYELEINALNKKYEVFFIWKDAFDKFDYKEFNVFDDNVFIFGGNHDRERNTFWDGSHPRGTRWAFRDWNLPGIKTAVQIDGKINDNTKVDKCWTVEIALPWSGLKRLANKRALPPKNNDVWKFQFARYEKLISLDTHVGWAWNPVGTNDNHVPEKFTPIKFDNEYLIT